MLSKKGNNAEELKRLEEEAAQEAEEARLRAEKNEKEQVAAVTERIEKEFDEARQDIKARGDRLSARKGT